MICVSEAQLAENCFRATKTEIFNCSACRFQTDWPSPLWSRSIIIFWNKKKKIHSIFWQIFPLSQLLLWLQKIPSPHLPRQCCGPLSCPPTRMRVENNETSSYVWHSFFLRVWINYDPPLIGFLSRHCNGKWRRFFFCFFFAGKEKCTQFDEYVLCDPHEANLWLTCAGLGLEGGINKAMARAANWLPSRSAPQYLFERVSDWLWFSLSSVQRKWIDGNQSPAGLSSGLPMNRLCTEHFFHPCFLFPCGSEVQLREKKCNCIIYQAYSRLLKIDASQCLIEFPPGNNLKIIT